MCGFCFFLLKICEKTSTMNLNMRNVDKQASALPSFPVLRVCVYKGLTQCIHVDEKKNTLG